MQTFRTRFTTGDHEIAYLPGYDEVRSFFRAFKRACIYTPTEYRVKRSLSGLGIRKKDV